MHKFFEKMGIENPIFVGASGGGMISQIYIQKYPKEVGGLVLISTGGMDVATLKSFKKQYFFAPIILFYMRHCNYEKLKPRLIKMGMGHIRDESKKQVAYAKEMFETIFKDFKQENLIKLMHKPEIKYVSGGHLSTVLKVDDYVKTIREFLQRNI